MRDDFYCCAKWLIIVCLLLKCLSSLTSQTLLPLNTLVIQLERISIAPIEITLPLEEKANQITHKNPYSKQPTRRPKVILKRKPRQGRIAVANNQLMPIFSSFEQLKSRCINKNKGIPKALGREMLYLISLSF